MEVDSSILSGSTISWQSVGIEVAPGMLRVVY
jgi:hypothetical protein